MNTGGVLRSASIMHNECPWGYHSHLPEIIPIVLDRAQQSPGDIMLQTTSISGRERELLIIRGLLPRVDPLSHLRFDTRVVITSGGVGATNELMKQVRVRLVK